MTNKLPKIPWAQGSTNPAPPTIRKKQVEPPIDKTTWGPGPWQDEPDRLEWRTAAGLPGMAIRHPESGSWCGYAAVAPGHPLFGKHYDEPNVSVHGGLTYANECQGHIRHTPEPGEPDHVWWFGFDCHHWMDLAPGMEAKLNSLMPARKSRASETYRDLAYVRAEVESLATQLSVAEPR